MEKKENVYEKTEGTGEESRMENGAKDDCRESAPTVPTKFKDVDALVRAYSALQSEFTRRSQRLKELERKVENLEGESLVGGSGVEKLRKNAQMRKAEMERFDHFVAETERGNAQEDGQEKRMDAEACEGTAPTLEEPTKEQPLEEPSGVENGENGDTMVALKPSTKAPAQVENDVGGGRTAEDAVKGMDMQAQEGERVASVAGSMPNVAPSEALYAQVCRDEKVRLRIIGEYLSSLGKSSAPLMTGGVGAFTTPPFRAANITEAGNMALLYFKKPLEK